jgi:hypothetical protein
MEVKAERFYRDQIILGLYKLPSGWLDKFDRIYGSVEKVPVDKLDSALGLVERSLLSLKIK